MDSSFPGGDVAYAPNKSDRPGRPPAQPINEVLNLWQQAPEKQKQEIENAGTLVLDFAAQIFPQTAPHKPSGGSAGGGGGDNSGKFPAASPCNHLEQALLKFKSDLGGDLSKMPFQQSNFGNLTTDLADINNAMLQPKQSASDASKGSCDGSGKAQDPKTSDQKTKDDLAKLATDLKQDGQTGNYANLTNDIDNLWSDLQLHSTASDSSAAGSNSGTQPTDNGQSGTNAGGGGGGGGGGSGGGGSGDGSGTGGDSGGTGGDNGGTNGSGSETGDGGGSGASNGTGGDGGSGSSEPEWEQVLDYIKHLIADFGSGHGTQDLGAIEKAVKAISSGKQNSAAPPSSKR